MDDRPLSRSPSISSLDSSNSSWSILGENDSDVGGKTVSHRWESESNGEEEQQLDYGETDDCDLELSCSESQDEDDSALDEEEDEVEVEEEEDGEDEEESEDDDDDDDDDMSVVSEEDLLGDSAARMYVDAVKVSRQLDELSKCFDSPFTRIVEGFASERNVRLMAVVSVAAVAVAVFYSTCGIREPKSLPFTSTESFCNIDEDRFFGLQHRDAAPHRVSLHSYDEAPLKPSTSMSVSPPSNLSPPADEPFMWLFNSGNIDISSEANLYIDTDHCNRIIDEAQFSAVSEAVQRYVKHTEKMKKLLEHDSLVLPVVNETLNDVENSEPSVSGNGSGKSQEDLELVKVDPEEYMNSIRTEASDNQELTKLETSGLEKPTSIPKLSLPIPPFSVGHLSIESKSEFPAPVPPPKLVQDFPLQRKSRKPVEKIPNVQPVEKPCVDVWPDITDSKLMKEERIKPQHANDLDALFVDLKFPKSDQGSGTSKKFRVQDNEEDAHKPRKSELRLLPSSVTLPRLHVKFTEPTVRIPTRQEHVTKAISSAKKEVWRNVERARAHSDELLEQFRKAVDNMVMRKQRKRAYKITEKAEERCVMNATCNALANFAQTLAGITLFPAIIGPTNAAKYIDSLLDLSACTGIRLVCEKCWWTKERCPEKKCKFLPWQRHFNTKRFLISQRPSLTEAFRKLGWSMPGKKCKGDGGKLKHEFDHPKYLAGLKKKMCPCNMIQQNMKKPTEWCYGKDIIGSRATERKTGVR